MSYSDLVLTEDTEVYDGYGRAIDRIPAGTMVQVYDPALGTLHVLYGGGEKAGRIVDPSPGTFRDNTKGDE